jgi:predicted small lipoprotein YifL
MKSLTAALAATFLALTLAGCAAKPPIVYPDAPPKKQADAKTQLESGRTY